MKLLQSLVFFSALILASCAEESPKITNPSSNKIPNWIQLPESEGMSVENQFSVTRYVDVQHGGELIIDKSYKGGPHGEVKVIAKFKIYENTVSTPLMVTMTIDDRLGIITFSPPTVFNRPSELYVKFEGLDLYNINPESIDFILETDGSTNDVFYESLVVDVPSGIIELKVPEFVVDNAQITYNVMNIIPLGKYGWVR